MDAPTNVIDNTQSWVKNQIDEYVATDGAEPKFRGGAPLVLLTYKGRTSGEWRRTCLIGAEYSGGALDGAWLLVASKGGSDDNPAWYPNLVENPTAWLQVGADYFAVTARTATPDEKPPLWARMVEIFPDYAGYQVKTDRDIPVVILERIAV